MTLCISDSNLDKTHTNEYRFSLISQETNTTEVCRYFGCTSLHQGKLLAEQTEEAILMQELITKGGWGCIRVRI